MSETGDEPGSGVRLPRLRAVRQARLQTQLDLSREAGVSHMTIRRVEHGYPARYETVRKLAAALGVEPEVLLGLAPLPRRLPPKAAAA
jgi:transcriptional regulator with XRE-family HTH domain